MLNPIKNSHVVTAIFFVYKIKALSRKLYVSEFEIIMQSEYMTLLALRIVEILFDAAISAVDGVGGLLP